MQIIKKMLKQTAVWWEKTGADLTGRATYDAPIEVKCRWEDIQEHFVDNAGRDLRSNAIVAVDRDMKPEDVLWHGTLADLESQMDPFANEGAYEIKKFSKIPTLNAKKFYREATL